VGDAAGSPSTSPARRRSGALWREENAPTGPAPERSAQRRRAGPAPELSRCRRRRRFSPEARWMRAPTRHGPAAGDVANLHPMRCPAAGSPSEFSAGQRPALTRRECYGRPGPETSRVFIRKRRMPEPSRCPARCRRRRRFSPEASDAGARPPRLAIRAPAAEWLGVQFHDADQSRAWRLGGTQLGAGGNSHRRPEAGDPGEGLAASDTMIPSPVRGELRPSGAVMAVAQGTSAQGGYCQEGCSSQCR
jgi:hypothetical protein